MTTVKDTIENDDEVIEGAEEATLDRKRNKSKYGGLIEADNE